MSNKMNASWLHWPISLGHLRLKLAGLLILSPLGVLAGPGRAYLLFRHMFRLHDYARAAMIMRATSHRFPHSDEAHSMRCTLAIRAGELDVGLPLLKASLAKHDFRAARLILFRKGTRPADSNQGYLVLEEIGNHPNSDLSLRCYSLIAQAYLILRTGDSGRATQIRAKINALIEIVRSREDVFSCHRLNRENITKIFVSLCTSGYHLSILLDDFDASLPYWRHAVDLLNNIDYPALNAGAALRMTSNFCRCLCLIALFDCKHDPDAFLVAIDALEQVHQSAESLNIASRETTKNPIELDIPQENHLKVLTEIHSALCGLTSGNPDVREPARARFAKLMNHANNSTLTEMIRHRLDGLEHHAVSRLQQAAPNS